MGLGLWLHLTEHHEHRHTHEPLEHSHMRTCTTRITSTPTAGTIRWESRTPTGIATSR